MAFAYKQLLNDDIMEFSIGIEYLFLTLKQSYPSLTKDELVSLLDDFSIHAAVIISIKSLLDKI